MATGTGALKDSNLPSVRDGLLTKRAGLLMRLQERGHRYRWPPQVRLGVLTALRTNATPDRLAD
jgi:hypothetical protein